MKKDKLLCRKVKSKIRKKIMKAWNDPDFLEKASNIYAIKSLEIAKKEFDTWQLARKVWVR